VGILVEGLLIPVLSILTLFTKPSRLNNDQVGHFEEDFVLYVLTFAAQDLTERRRLGFLGGLRSLGGVCYGLGWIPAKLLEFLIDIYYL